MSEYRSLAVTSVDSIIEDLTSRQGLQDVWYNIDEDIQTEIMAEWADIIEKNMKWMCLCTRNPTPPTKPDQ